MKARKFFALLLSVIMVLSMMPITVFAYWEEPSAEDNVDLEMTVYDYTKPVGVTMQRLTGNSVAEFGEDGNLGDDLLFVIKSGDRYYAMKDVAASETAYDSIPAVDVTDWVNADGSLTVPADTLDVAFWRYEQRPEQEYGMFINGRENYIAYSYDYESADGDDDYYNDAERNYWGKFKINTFEDGGYISSDPYYWSENGTSGTLKFGGTWSYKLSSYNYLYLRYELITDLREDGNGGKEFYFRYLGTDVEYVGDEVEGYLYYADCRHQGTIRHAEYDAPTCMLKGCEEYWYCENCNQYAKDESFTEFFGEEMPIIPATGHDFDNEKCKNCNRPVPVYSKVTNQAQFDALADDTMFILVAEYNGKYYAMDFSEVYSYMTDSDGDGYYDIHDIDEDGDGHPDYLEFDEGGEEGVYDYLEWDMDSDGDVDESDILEFHYMICDQHMTDTLYNNGVINATEIKINPDGTFSHEEAKKTAEFEMVDVYLAEDYDPDWHSHWENGEMPYHTKCVKQFAIPNYFISAPSMSPIERMYRQRIYEFGDCSHWGVIFYDSREEYYSYVDGNMDEKVDADEDGKADPLPFPDVNKEGSVAVFDTFDDIMWILYEEGQNAQLRIRDYNDTIGFVTGHDYELEGSEWIYDETTEIGYYDTHDTQACVYLYASAPYDSHTCDFGDWTDDGNGRTHTRRCTGEDCNEEQTEDHNWDDGVETDPPSCTETGIKTFTCSDCKTTRTEDIPNCDHAYVWMEGKTSTCIEEGIVPHYHCEDCGKNFDENKGEIDSVELPIGSHEYGPMYWGKSANFWEDGNIEYYQCFECEKYFDGEYNEIETPVIPRYSTNLSICVNGTPTALVLGEQRENFIEWSLEGLSVTKGDVITICQTDNPEIRHQYFADGNVGTDGKILTTAAAANVALTATPNGLMLFIDGYKYEGIVIEINGVQYPMIYTSYPDETTTYIYGYVNFAVGDKFVIVDNVSGTVYDYDDLDPSFAWDAWDFHRGDNGEFVIDYACRYGIEFDYGGNKKIYINKTFAPLDGGSYGLAIENADLVALEQMQIPSNSESYDEFMWYIAHEDVVNNEDIVSYVGEKGLYVYIVKLQLEEGTRFNIKNLTANSAVNAEHLVEVYTESGSITKDGDYVRILKSGYYSIVYLPCCNGFMIEETKQPADVYMYLDGEFIPLVKGDGNIVTYEGLVADTSTNVMFTDNTYTTYLLIALDSQTNASIAHVFEYNGMSMLYFDKAGTYNLSYNVETGVLSITSVGGDGGEDTEFDPSKYLYYLSVSGGSGSTQTIVMQAGDSNEFCAKNVTLTESCFIGVIEMTKDGSTSTTYGAVADTDTSIAQSYGTVAMVKIAGTYDVYFNTDAKTIKLVAVTSGSTEEKAMPKDIYIRYDNILILSESPENADELCYLGLEMGAWDEFQIRDTDKNYIADITLAEGTTGVVTNGRKITFQVGGTFDIYINKTTHEIRIVAAHECTWSDWSSNGDGTHTRTCRCNAHEIKDCEWNEGVVDVPPTHTELGTMLYTCTVCQATKTEDIPTLTDHAWGDWEINQQGDLNIHIHFCICGASETAPHNFDDGVVTEPATHTSEGVMTYTCKDCGYTYDEEISTTPDHEWSEWDLGETADVHTRFCECGESDSAAHEFGDEETVLQPTDNSIHVRSACSVCGYEKDTVVTGTVVTFTNCEGLNVNPLIFVQNGDETAFTLKLPTAADVAEREGYKLVGWTASIDGINYSSGAELFIAYADASAITFSAEWAMVVGEGEQKLAANEAYIADMDAFEIEGEGITYQGDQVFYVPKDGIYALIESKNDEEVE